MRPRAAGAWCEAGGVITDERHLTGIDNSLLRHAAHASHLNSRPQLLRLQNKALGQNTKRKSKRKRKRRKLLRKRLLNRKPKLNKRSSQSSTSLTAADLRLTGEERQWEQERRICADMFGSGLLTLSQVTLPSLRGVR
ncbi:hypothetical protein F2P79_003204 [Pimephales promelas]|nr:hypothetical protein F2P79_003204 [Pimephales promelas]